jgi:hypothetical protein
MKTFYLDKYIFVTERKYNPEKYDGTMSFALI